MPDPRLQAPEHPMSQRMREILGNMPERGDRTDVMTEIKGLREEVRQLVGMLKPVESLVATGKQVLDEYKKLRGQ